MPADIVHGTARGDGRVCVRLEDLIALERRVNRATARVRPATSVHAGVHAGRRRGRGMDYLESRAYQSGDDVRHLDWRLTARRGSPHTKVFQEESEHSVMLLVDCHDGMRFGTRERFKSVQAAHAAALVAWRIAHAGGRVGALAFGACRDVQRALAGRRGALAVCGALARWDTLAAQDAEPLAVAFERLRPLLAGSSQVVLVSDGRSSDARTRATLAAWRRRTRLSVLLVTDALESKLPPAGIYPLQGETRRARVDLTTEPARQRFRQAMGGAADQLGQTCQSLGLPWRHVDAHDDPMDAVTALTGRT